MWDRETESWWQQLTAEAIVGELTGAATRGPVRPRSSPGSSSGAAIPTGRVLSRETGSNRDYGRNPYVGYDDPDSQPFLLDGEADSSLPPKERVAAIRTGERSAVVYAYSRLAEEAPMNDEIDARKVVVLFDPDVRSALDTPLISAGRKVGAAAVFERTVDGRPLAFESGPNRGEFRDTQTGSIWNMSGVATSGELEGTRLGQIAHDDQFWFALAAFYPRAEIRR